MSSYRPFVVRIAGRIGQPEGDSYPLTAEFQGLQAHAAIPAAVLRQCLAELSAIPPHATPQARNHLGNRLFAALFVGEVLELYETANRWLAPGERLRIVLDQPLPDGLAALPWELIFDAQGEPKSLRNAPNTPVVRHAPSGAWPHAPPQSGALRVLTLVALPPDVAGSAVPPASLRQGLGLRDTLRLLVSQLDAAALQEAGRRLTQGRRYRVTVLDAPTADAIRDELTTAAHEDAPYHIVHFFGQASQDGSLLLPTSGGGRQAVTPAEFADLVLTDSLMVLAATLCQTEPVGETIRAVAEEATRRGAPAAIGMQAAAFDRATVDFSREFYRALAAGEPIELALAYGRRLVRRLHGDRELSNPPALYMPHTGGLRLPALERVHVVPRAWRVLSWLLATAFAIVGTTSGILDLPSFPHLLRERAPVIRCLWPNPMDSNRLTIAFLPLTTVTADGRPTHGADGHAVADFLYQRFAPALADLKLSVPYEIRSPDLACQLPGGTAAERSAAAADYARRIGADILIYGVITDTVQADRMALAFNVDYRGYDNADEISGPFALGGSLPITLPFDSQELLVIEHPPHLVRMNVLAELVVGLSYLRADNPDKALTYFDAATADPYWPRVDGKEFAYLLKAQALTRQASLTGQVEAVTAALAAYDEALAIRPGYVRAQLGKASALVTLAAAGLAADGSHILDAAKLAEAEAAYRTVMARDAALTPLEWSTAHAGLGYVYLTRELYREPPYDFSAARGELEAVQLAYEDGKLDIARIAGLTYGYLGLIADAQGDKETASGYYGRAIALVTPVSRAMYLWKLSVLRCQLGEQAAAIDFGTRAVDEARLYSRAVEVERYTSRLEALKAASCPPGQ